MEISEVKIFKAKQKGAVLAYANIVIDNNFIIRGITLLETERAGRFIARTWLPLWTRIFKCKTYAFKRFHKVF